MSAYLIAPRLRDSQAGSRVIPAGASVKLDLVRGVAAIAVMVGHVRSLFFQDYANLVAPGLGTKFLYAATGLGHEAVIVFFVLSGFFIGASVLKSVAAHKWSWRSYLTHRFVRLWIVLLPALSLGAAIDWAGVNSLQASATYFSPVRYLSSVSFASRFTLRNFTGNLFFLQGIFVDPFGSNGPLWSLSYEFWYYMIFPALVLLLVPNVPIALRGAFLIAAAAMFWFVGPAISIYFLIWLAGTAVFAMFLKLPSIRGVLRVALQIAGWLILFGGLAWVRSGATSAGLTADFILAGCFSVWMLAISTSGRSQPTAVTRAIAKTLSGCSYTLYLIHFPLLAFLRTQFDPAGNWPPDARHFGPGILLALAALAFAYCIAFFTEFRTAAVRKRVEAWVGN
jgi:peptidoglycan/LPS O-acetylase OafA/YrhL